MELNSVVQFIVKKQFGRGYKGLAAGSGWFYNHNGQAQQGVLEFAGQNQSGYWFSWRDNFGAGQLVLQEYTDGSLRGQMFINDGTNPGKLLGDWIGLR